VRLEFLSPSPGGLARSPMERQALGAGATLEQRDGWNLAVRFEGEQVERERCAATVGFADLSHLGKLEVHAAPAELDALAGESLALGRASRVDGVWCCPYTSERALAVCEPGDLSALRERLEDAAAERDALTSVIDVTSAFAALAIAGPLAREVFARFTALDLRDSVTPVRGFRPGSVARTPGAVLREAEGRWLMLFGAALGQYMWTVVADAAESLGGGPVAADALPSVEEPIGADAPRSVAGPIAREASPRA
jgi:heterotetrameric sarcosine oxidase gamma subunit